MNDSDFCRLLILGKLEEAQLLLDQHSIDINKPLPCNLRPLTVALKLKSIDAVRMLLLAGADVSLSDSASGNSIIFNAYWDASEAEEPAELGLPFDAGLSVDYAERNGVTLLMQATWAYVWTTRFLLERGANPNPADADGWTALMIAVSDVSGLDPDSSS